MQMNEEVVREFEQGIAAVMTAFRSRYGSLSLNFSMTVHMSKFGDGDISLSYQMYEEYDGKVDGADLNRCLYRLNDQIMWRAGMPKDKQLVALPPPNPVRDIDNTDDYIDPPKTTDDTEF